MPDASRYTFRVAWSVEDGKFLVRVPAEVHRRLVLEAAEQHVCLNRLVSDRLARA
jgi:predicted HicB family RNase H-like nuclease